MDLPLIIVLLVLLAAALFILPPLLREEKGEPAAPPDPSRDALAEAVARRDASFEALADLEFDHASGKISTEEFATLKAQYQRAAVTALKDVEGLAPGAQEPRDRNGNAAS